MNILVDEFAAANILSTTPRRVRRLVRDSKIPYRVLPDGEVRFVPGELEEWIFSLPQTTGHGETFPALSRG